MPLVLACMLALAGQMNTLQPRQVVHLQPNKAAIQVDFNGSVLVLMNAPDVVKLPTFPPKPTAAGVNWSIQVKNYGPHPVTLSDDRVHFLTQIEVGQTMNIDSNGSEYIVRR